MKKPNPLAAERDAAPSRPVTTRTVAEAAGVNVSTVSRALRGVRGVSAEERARIRKVASRLGYRPNPFVAAFTAQVRAYRRSPVPATIALLDCWPVERPPWASFDGSIDYVDGIRDRAAALGYGIERVRLADLDNSLDRLQRLLRTRRIYGVLVLPVPEGVDLSGLDFSRFACATIDFSLQQPALIRRASPHYYHNMWLALATLASRGYRRIGYAVTSFASQAEDHMSLAAFLAFGARHPGLCVAPCLIDTVDARQRDLVAWMRREKPDALVSVDFMMPDDLIKAGRRVPEEVAAVALCRPPGHTTAAYIDENYREVGAQAVDMIVDAIHRNELGLPAARIVHFVDGFWHEGRTVRPPSFTAQGCDPSMQYNVSSAR